jgi:hypothetical protein
MSAPIVIVGLTPAVSANTGCTREVFGDKMFKVAEPTLNLAPDPTNRLPPGVHVVAIVEGGVKQNPTTAFEVTAVITPEPLVVTLSTGLVLQPGPAQVIVPDTLAP